MKSRIGHIAAATLVTVSVGAAAQAGSPTPGRMIIYHGGSGVDAVQGHSTPANAQNAQALALKSGTVLSNTLRVGDPFGFPAVQFAYTAGTAGLAEADFTFTSTAGPRQVTINYHPPVYTTKGNVPFAYPSSLPYYLAPGTWTLTGATIYDYSFNSTVYTASQLATLFTANSFSVVNNGPVDSQPPVLGTGKLLNPTISLSAPHPQLKATLKVSDAGTGVNYAILFLTPPGADYSEGTLATIPLPVKSGTLTLYDDFFAGEPTGTWTIYELQVCDFASNCDTITDPQAITALFGANSVTVTN